MLHLLGTYRYTLFTMNILLTSIVKKTNSNIKFSPKHCTDYLSYDETEDDVYNDVNLGFKAFFKLFSRTLDKHAPYKEIRKKM